MRPRPRQKWGKIMSSFLSMALILSSVWNIEKQDSQWWGQACLPRPEWSRVRGWCAARGAWLLEGSVKQIGGLGTLIGGVPSRQPAWGAFTADSLWKLHRKPPRLLLPGDAAAAGPVAWTLPLLVQLWAALGLRLCHWPCCSLACTKAERPLSTF